MNYELWSLRLYKLTNANCNHHSYIPPMVRQANIHHYLLAYPSQVQKYEGDGGGGFKMNNYHNCLIVCYESSYSLRVERGLLPTYMHCIINVLVRPYPEPTGQTLSKRAGEESRGRWSNL